MKFIISLYNLEAKSHKQKTRVHFRSLLWEVQTKEQLLINTEPLNYLNVNFYINEEWISLSITTKYAKKSLGISNTNTLLGTCYGHPVEENGTSKGRKYIRVRCNSTKNLNLQDHHSELHAGAANSVGNLNGGEMASTRGGSGHCKGRVGQDVGGVDCSSAMGLASLQPRG